MMDLKRIIFIVMVLSIVSGCGAGSDKSEDSEEIEDSGAEDTPVVEEKINVNGSVEKGPFIVGSTVTINILTENGENTGTTIVTNTTDNLGSFRFSVDKDQLLQTTSTGYYRNEITGELSDGILTLRSIFKVGDAAEQYANVNLLTHLTSNRVLQLIRTSDISYEQAIQQTETEFLSTFGRVIENSSENKFSSLSIYESQGSNGSAYLLAMSSIIYQYAIDRSGDNSTTEDAELALLINEIEEDFGLNGEINDVTKIELLIDTQARINPSQVVANVESWILGGIEYTVPDVNDYLDSDLDGVVNATDLDDDNDGIEDDVDNSPFNPGFVVTNQGVDTDEEIGISINVSANNPLNEDIEVNIVDNPNHGVLSGSYPELSYIPNENYNGEDTFSYFLSQGELISDEVDVSISISPVNDKPIISGIPTIEIIASNDYSFTPDVINIENDHLQFSIENLPQWATFSVNTGVLSGTPSNEDSGLYENISISVTDGSLSDSLEVFDIDVLNDGIALSVAEDTDFFVVKGVGGISPYYYSGSSTFKFNEDGYFVNSFGLGLHLFPVDKDGDVVAPFLASGAPLQVDFEYGYPNATTNVQVNVNLPEGNEEKSLEPLDAVLDSDSGCPTSNTYNASTVMNVYDALGTNYKLGLFFIKTSTANNTWEVRATIDCSVINSASTQVLDFDNAGDLDILDSDGDGAGVSGGGVIEYQGISVESGAEDLNIRVDFRSYDLSSTRSVDEPFSLDYLYQNGNFSDDITELTIDSSGLVRLRFVTRSDLFLGKTAMAQFANQDGLNFLGKSVWAETVESGAAIVGQAENDDFGAIEPVTVTH